MNNFKCYLLLFVGLICSESIAQDAQFTQFYAAPLYLNPAFAGATPCWRTSLTYRNQWSFGGAPYSTGLVSIDYNLRKIRSGVGGYVFHDNPIGGGFETYEIAPMFAKEIKINNDLNIRFGVQPSYHLKSQTQRNFTFADQYTDLQPVGGTADQGILPTMYNFFDISSGLLLYSERFWLGLSIHHILNNSLLLPANRNFTPIKLSLHGGLNIELSDGYQSLLKPVFQLKMQGPNMQADLGCYYERSQWMFGMWYRGIPIINSSLAAINQDALAFLVGLKINSFQVGYSYDLPLSRMIYSFGSHEISGRFEFCLQKSRKPPKYIRQLPCPKF